jgi:hypothetical protein
MKNFFYRILFAQLLLLSCSTGFSQSHKLDSVKIEFEGFDTKTFVDVTCDAFNSTFLTTKKIKVVQQKQNLLEFESLRKNFEQARDRSFDVRGKVTYFYGATAVKYCFDIFGYFYKDGRLYHNKKLLIAVANDLYSNHPKYLDTLRYHE